MNGDFVLLADDNSTDAELTTRALEIGGVSKNIIWVQDGEAALHFVFRTGPFAGRPTPNPRLMLPGTLRQACAMASVSASAKKSATRGM